MTSPLLTPEQVGQRIQVKPTSVTEWCRTGALRATKATGRWRITEEDLAEFLNSGFNRPRKRRS